MMIKYSDIVDRNIKSNDSMIGDRRQIQFNSISCIMRHYLVAGGFARLTQLRFTNEPSLMLPGGFTRT